MAINFPLSPTLNQLYTYNGKTWKWNGYAWSYQDSPLFSTFTASNTAPSSPNPGDRWLKIDESIEFTWYVDTDGGQWVEL